MEKSCFVNDGSIFLPWIEINKLDIYNLSLNSNVHHLANKYPHLINWKYGSYNKSLIPYFEKYKDELHWHGVSQHSECIEFLLKNHDEINFYGLSSNLSDKAKSLFKNDKQRRNYNQSPYNYSLIDDRFNLPIFDRYWHDLSIDHNPESLEILKNNPGKIDYLQLSKNPGIFQPDYKIYMKKSKEKLWKYYQELMAKSLHPSRIIKHLDAGMDIDDL